MTSKEKIHPAFKPEFQISLREKMGASQDHFSLFLHIPKSTLSMVELGKRPWPVKTKNKTEILQAMAMAENETWDFSEYDQLNAEDLNPLENRYLVARRDAFRLKKELKKMAFEYQTACTMLKTCRFLRDFFQHEESLERKVIAYWETTGKLKLAETCPARQDVLSREIEWLEKAMELWKPFYKGE